MKVTTAKFPENVKTAISDKLLQATLTQLQTGFVLNRTKASEGLDEFEKLRDQAASIKNHTRANLDAYLEIFEKNVSLSGGHVHWCIDDNEARRKILEICQNFGAKTVTKGKSMVGEEIEINPFLEKNNIEPIETDLGEYILQLRNEAPSHLIAPASHVSKDQITELFRKSHTQFPLERELDKPGDLLAEARNTLRTKFLNADIGITGANFLIAETGSSVIVTNEGNGDLTQTLPQVHIVLASIEKVVPTLEDVTTLLRVLARSATGQEMSSYTTFSTGPKRTNDADGPKEFHVVLLDNGRTDLLAGEFAEILNCIRCGACLNHCPVYGAIGGHAYGWVYPGPMGSVLTPGLTSIETSQHLPQASTFCGKCEEVCPVRIPLPDLLRQWRNQIFQKRLTDLHSRWGMGIWAFFAKRPSIYQFSANMKMLLLSILGRKKGYFHYLPLAKGWVRNRNFPAPEGRTFQKLWRKKRAK